MSLDTRLTAFAIARVRAEEAALPVPQRLFEDAYAHSFDEPHADVSAVFQLIPFFREHVRLRTRFFDDAVRAALVERVRTVVLLGAGFDTRALRLSEIVSSGARVIEVDYAEQLADKWRRLREAGVAKPDCVSTLGLDLSSEDLASQLEQGFVEAGAATDAAVLWVAEGLFGYLNRATLERLALATAALSDEGSLFVANHFASTWSEETLSDIFAERGWQPSPGPSFEELHQRWIGSSVPAGSELFALWIALR